MTRDDIKRQYIDFEKVPFPIGLGGEEINGVEVVLVDTYAAGLIHSYAHSKTGLDQAQYDLLMEVWNDLNMIMDDLPEHGKAYFQTLYHLVEEVLRLSKENKG
jgi:hypothetical protein